MNRKIWSLILMWSLVLMLLVVVALPCKAAETDEKELGIWVEASIGTKTPSGLVVYYDRMVTNTVGFYALTVKESDGYRSFYAGPKFKLGEGIEAGIGIGREASPKHVVRNMWVSVDTDNFLLYATVERSSTTWHKATAMYKMSGWNLGVMHETGLGFGPRVEYALAKNAQVWLAVLNGKPIMAVNFSF